jgi:hypothetical protein
MSKDIINVFSVFESKLRTGYKPVPGSNGLFEPIYTPCLTMVCETKTSRGYAYIVFSVDHKASKSVIVYAQSKASFLTPEVENTLSALCTPATANKYVVVTDPHMSLSVSPSDLLITKKLDNLFYASVFNKANFTSLKLADRDTNKVTLNAYIHSIATLMDTTGNPVQLADVTVKTPPRKWCFPRKQIDWDLFWNSSQLTDKEKRYCKMPLDLQVAFANKDLDLRKIVERVAFKVAFMVRNWNLNVFHGVPGGGKTTMIMKDICAVNNIPCLYINGDQKATINKMIEIVGPRNNAQGVAELTLVEGIWAKCMLNNIPLVVFIDEIDTLGSLELKNLGTLATSGKATINTSYYSTDTNCIYYFGAFNPGSIDGHEFPDSFDDRIMWYKVPKPSLKSQTDYLYNAYSVMFGVSAKQKILQTYIDKLETLRADSEIDSVLDSKISNLILRFNSLSLENATEESLKWFCQEQIDKLTSTSSPVCFEEGVFKDIYADQVSNIDFSYDVIDRINKLFHKMNIKLAELTRGVQKTKRSRDSVITIPNRAFDVFVDLIFSYSSVAKAFEFIIMNRLPEGFVLNVPGANTQAGVDHAPKSIYTALYNYMQQDIEDLHNFLFTSVNSKDAEDEYLNSICNLQHVEASTPTLQQSHESAASILDKAIGKSDSTDSVNSASSWAEVDPMLG